MSTARKRLDALLVAEATDRLSAADKQELAALLADYPDVDRYAYERAAAAVFLAACTEPPEPMPSALSGKLAADAAHALRELN